MAGAKVSRKNGAVGKNAGGMAFFRHRGLTEGKNRVKKGEKQAREAKIRENPCQNGKKAVTLHPLFGKTDAFDVVKRH
ncbi:MAG: hypothetical protein K6D55_01310 [Prevotella sp.]|nr:hypothetical protein [Prevotella sp.]